MNGIKYTHEQIAELSGVIQEMATGQDLRYGWAIRDVLAFLHEVDIRLEYLA